MQTMDMVRSRDHGKLIPGWQRGRLKVWRGLLLVKMEHVAPLFRQTRVARIYMLDRSEQPPPLWDAQPVEMTIDYWTYTGLERIDDGIGGFVDYAQTWVLVPAREESHCGHAGSERL